MAAINNAGGSGFAVTDAQRLLRFLILGSEGGTYYSSERKLTLENAAAIHRLIKNGKGNEVVATLVDVSTNGRATKQSPTLFALAMVACFGSDKEKAAAYKAVDAVCRTPTMLFEFIDLRVAMDPKGKGWGVGMRNAIARFYLRDPTDVAFAVTKYRQRGGWTHRDVLRCVHVKPPTPLHALVFHYIVKNEIPTCAEDADPAMIKLDAFFRAVDIARCMSGTTPARIAKLIDEHDLAREHIHSAFLRESRTVWFALLKKMGRTALIRNLGKMTSIGFFDIPVALEMALAMLSDEKAMKRARVHPMTILVAKTTYDSGHGDKGKLEWSPNASISAALEEAFYSSFGHVEPTGKRYLLALDVSGSMSCGGVCGSSLTPRDASAAMVMVTLRTEEKCCVMGFSHKLVPLPIAAHHDLGTVGRIMSSTPMGATDCAVPMVWALENRVETDVFVIYTDNETWFGAVKPNVALRNYRAKMGIDARLVVVAMTSAGFSIADPGDSGMLDVVGFDTATPQIMREFALGGI